jgi:hypothetical protein
MSQETLATPHTLDMKAFLLALPVKSASGPYQSASVEGSLGATGHGANVQQCMDSVASTDTAAFWTGNTSESLLC